jgi:aminocarboxymuconate-semialdehyde decarboxylase
MIVDIHAHFAPPEWIDIIRRNGAPYGSRIEEDKSGHLWLRLGQDNPLELLPSLSDLSARRQAMAARGIDRQVLSAPMFIVGYHLEEREGQALCRLFNETIVATASESEGHLIPVATVPMQSKRAAVEELEYAVKKLGIRMVIIGTNVNGANLDEETFRSFFARAADLGVLVQLHPYHERVAGVERLHRYYLCNLIGNPMDTAIAAASLILGGVLESYAPLNVCLVHGGGALPYLLGRVSYGYFGIKATHTIARPPDEYFRRFYFDTIVHDARALLFLHDLVGPEHLMLGTDYPYDHTGEPDPLGALERAGLRNCNSILGGNAATLLGLES